MPMHPNERELVAKGAAFMDKILPGWYKRVDLKALNMGNGAMCLLGQTFGVHNELSLAKEMYPEEFEETFANIPALYKREPKLLSWGYFLASSEGCGQGMIETIMRKLGLTDANSLQEHKILEDVCYGHDNRCEWASEITDRLARDKEMEDA